MSAGPALICCVLLVWRNLQPSEPDVDSVQSEKEGSLDRCPIELELGVKMDAGMWEFVSSGVAHHSGGQTLTRM